MDPDATGHFRITGQTDKNGDFAWATRDGGQVGKGREVDNMARAVRSGRGLANVAGDMALDYSAFGALTLTPVLTAYDKAASVRSIDADGKMRVADSRISKATVNPYYGKEIPDYEKLGLDPEKKYMLYRDPEELKKAVDTFNNLPILSRHQPVTATDFPSDLIIGATGTDAAFDGEYLTNSLAFWPKSAIDKIEDGDEKQLSCAYRYVPDMQPGESPDGQKYDGRMTKLAGNHLALVKEGRAGPDVMVADAKPHFAAWRSPRWPRAARRTA